jgi:hypothetical protein
MPLAEVGRVLGHTQPSTTFRRMHDNSRYRVPHRAESNYRSDLLSGLSELPTLSAALIADREQLT